MEKKLSFNEVLPIEELDSGELDAIVGGKSGIKIIGTKGDHCSCGDTKPTTATDSTSVTKP